MRICKITDLSGGEILAKAIMTSDYQILLSEGTKLKKEYIQKLEELGIKELFIKEDVSTEEILIIKNEFEKKVKEEVKGVLEKHTYSNNEELVELSKTADSIIDNILEQKEVIEKVYDIKERNSDIYEHSINICSLAILLSVKMGLSDRKIHDIGVACLLHDLGLRYITVDYINKDINYLSDAELLEYKKHTIYGYSVLKNETWMSELSKSIILYHHECLDGSGYPLKAKDNPIEVRIVNICERFDEMICGIGCERVKVYEAIKHLKQNKDILYDGKIVDAFLELIAVYPAGSYIVTNRGEVGIIIRQNKNHPDKPFIKIIFDEKGERVQGDVVKDLLTEEDTYITEVIEDINNM